MRKIALILLAVLFGLNVRAFNLVLTNGPLTGTIDESSYDTADSGYILSGRYLRSYFDGMYPAWTNHFYSISHSGENWQDHGQSLEKYVLPMWASNTNLIWDFKLTTDNGGYPSNSVYQYGTNIDLAPGLFWNGSALTNEGGIAATLTVSHFTLGAIPHDSTDGDGGEIVRNDACTNLSLAEGTPIVDTWHYCWTNNSVVSLGNGWTNGVNGFYPGAHPYPAGQLEMTFGYLKMLNADTNVGSFTMNWSAGTVANTNHWVITSPSLSGNVLTFTAHADRMPFAWDVPDGTVTNDATGVFTVYPSLAQSFQWVLQVTNLPSGNYTVSIDGSNVMTCTDAQLAAGTNMFTLYQGAFWAQRRAVQFAIDDLYGVDHTTLLNAHNAGSNGTLGQPDLINYNSYANTFFGTDGHRGDTYISDMATPVAGLQAYDVAIHNAAVQTNHTFSITLAQPRCAPFHR